MHICQPRSFWTRPKPRQPSSRSTRHPEPWTLLLAAPAETTSGGGTVGWFKACQPWSKLLSRGLCSRDNIGSLLRGLLGCVWLMSMITMRVFWWLSFKTLTSWVSRVLMIFRLKVSFLEGVQKSAQQYYPYTHTARLHQKAQENPESLLLSLIWFVFGVGGVWLGSMNSRIDRPV